MSLRRLPDGRTTADALAYSDAWRSHAAPLLAATGWDLLGFDPGYLFDAGTHTVSLTTHEVALLSRIVSERDEALAHLHGRPLERGHARVPLAGADPSEPCCARWNALRSTLRWFADETSQTRAVPCLVDSAGDFVRVQYCPSCGAPRRDVTWPGT